jgi:MFS family permease
MTPSYFLLLSLQALERLAWWMVLVHIALFITETDYPGGLGLSHTEKGIIFFVWAMAKNLVPIFSSKVVVSKGAGLVLFVGSTIGCVGYAVLTAVSGLWDILGSVMLMGLGIGAFQNALQSLIARSDVFEKIRQRRVMGWAGYQWIVNIAVLIGGFLSAKLIAGGINQVFTASTMIMAVVSLFSLYLYKKADGHIAETKAVTIGSSFTELKINRAFRYSVLSFAMFTFAYMQFYETLPNYLASYADSSSLGNAMQPLANLLGDNLSQLGFRIEYLYNLNAAITLIAIIPMAFALSKVKAHKAYIIGMVFIALGHIFLFLGGGAWQISMLFLVYTIGEAIVNPQILTIAETTATEKDKKPVYLGLMYLAWAFGLGFGGLIGGWAYDQFVSMGGLAFGYDPVLFWLLPVTAVAIGIALMLKGQNAENYIK